MGAMLSSHYRRGSRLAVDTFAWLVGARGAAALRALSSSPSSSAFSSSKNNVNNNDDSMALEERFLCPCYYTENFFIKKVRARKGERGARGRPSSRVYTVCARACVCARAATRTLTHYEESHPSPSSEKRNASPFRSAPSSTPPQPSRFPSPPTLPPTLPHPLHPRPTPLPHTHTHHLFLPPHLPSI